MRLTSILALALAGGISLAAAKAQGHYSNVKQPAEAGAHDQPPPARYGRSHGGSFPHEEAFPDWKLEPGEEDHDNKFYRTQKEQFEDLHNRIQALVRYTRPIRSPSARGGETGTER